MALLAENSKIAQAKNSSMLSLKVSTICWIQFFDVTPFHLLLRQNTVMSSSCLFLMYLDRAVSLKKAVC